MNKLRRSRNCIGLGKYRISTKLSEALLRKLEAHCNHFQKIEGKKIFFKGETSDFQCTGVYPGERITLVVKYRNTEKAILESFMKLIEGK